MVCLISKSKAALHYVLFSLWVIHPQHKKKVVPIFGCKQINQLNDYSKFKRKKKNQKKYQSNKTQTQTKTEQKAPPNSTSHNLNYALLNLR